MTDDVDRAPCVDTTLRQLSPRASVAYREREPGRLQLRFVLAELAEEFGLPYGGGPDSAEDAR
jgi:hypothetical protein